MTRKHRTAVALLGTIALVLTGCSVPQHSPEPTAEETTVAKPAVERWSEALEFMSEVTTQAEVVCGTPGPDLQTPAVVPFSFHAFADRSEWEPFLVPPRTGRDWNAVIAKGQVCSVVVPTTVPYTDANVEGFLNPLGLSLMDSSASSGLTFTEIYYAGAFAEDPDIVYSETPGLWALYISLGPIRAEALNGSEIIPPTTEEQAERWLTFAQPALDWFDYTE